MYIYSLVWDRDAAFHVTSHVQHLIIDNIDYVTGIGNSSREQYIRAARDNPCHIDLPKNHKNVPQKMAKNRAFFKYFRQYLPNKNT